MALFQLGQEKDATTAVQEAIHWLPLVAKELLKAKHRRPKSAMPGYITLGGADEAYEYWQRHGRFWEETAGALTWLAETVQTTSKRKGRK